MPCWTTVELKRLRAIYPGGSREQVQAALPRHTWQAIIDCAVKQGVARRPLIELRRAVSAQQKFIEFRLSWMRRAGAT